jgi:histidyl-tRNA synthetase
MPSIQSPRGTQDILPSEVRYWQMIEEIARDTLSRAAYQEIRTPIFESTELFERGIGEATDVVGKEMYTFRDRGDRSITLRPEGTAGTARAYIQHGLYAQGGVQRLWYSGPIFRYERPKTGRQRQFHQLGLELIGSANPRADAEAIYLAQQILQAVGVGPLRLEINSVGTAADRQRYRDALVEFLTPYQADLDPDSQDRLSRNPMRILDSKDAKTQDIVRSAPSILDYLSPESQAFFDKVKACLDQLGIDYVLNSRLVRGLDYYTHTAFEFIADELGTEATVCGGGRYDGLIQQLGGPETPAIGWAIGLERLTALLQQQQPVTPATVDLYLASRGEAAETQALGLAAQLQQQGFRVELDLSGSAFKKQFIRADRSGAIACLIVGESEAETQTVQIKWLHSGEQIAQSQAELLANVETFRQQLDAARA